jgi:hypothetical protein
MAFLPGDCSLLYAAADKGIRNAVGLEIRMHYNIAIRGGTVFDGSGRSG